MTDRERIADLLEAVPEMSFRCDTESEQREQTLALAVEVERLIRDAAERAYVEAVLACAGTVDEIYKPVALPADFPLVKP